jgi:hypothetical protein
MAQDKEKLKKLLDFIKALAEEEGNEWFVDELKMNFPSVQTTQGNLANSMEIENLNMRISSIEKYLGLDFSTDTTDSIIDYSRIGGKENRNRLESDNREMLRWRYGTRSHIQDFYEYCRCAHQQAEFLLNYFYENVEQDLQSSIQHIKWFLPDYFTIRDTISDVSEIPYANKLSAFYKEHQNELGFYNRSILEKTNTTRNELLHRSPSNKDLQEWKKFFNTMKNSGFPVSEISFDFKVSEIKKDEQLYRNFIIKYGYTNKEYQNYLWHLFVERKPYGEVLQAVKTLAGIIQSKVVPSDR